MGVSEARLPILRTRSATSRYRRLSTARVRRNATDACLRDQRVGPQLHQTHVQGQGNEYVAPGEGAIEDGKRDECCGHPGRTSCAGLFREDMVQPVWLA